MLHKNVIITGSDGGFLKIFDINTMQKYFEEKFHDYIRSKIIHPKLPIFISCDDAGHIISFKVVEAEKTADKDGLNENKFMLQKFKEFAVEHNH